MGEKIAEKLEWQILLGHLSEFCQTLEGKRKALQLEPKLQREEVLKRWALSEPLVGMIKQGFVPSIGELIPIAASLKSIAIGQILDAEDFKPILSLLETTQRVCQSARDLASVCSTLSLVEKNLSPLPKLLDAITRAINPDGTIRDDATPELRRIRTQKRILHKRIEETLGQITRDTEFSNYLQDDFFTIREDRYVVPVRLDGRGRVEGAIIATSTSGHTLFIEPAAISQQNQNLKELELSEKLEIFRILKELTALVRQDSETLQANYLELVSLDLLFAEAQLAFKLDAHTIALSETPVLNLKGAIHPFIKLNESGRHVVNDIILLPGQHGLIISGPNAGGKTVILKTVGMVHMMVAAGLMPPVDAESELFLFKNIYIEMGDTQDMSAQLSTFSGHLLGLKPILERTGGQDLVLLDEICVGTEPHAGAALAQAILEHISTRRSWVVATTHFDNLKILAMNSAYFRSGAMGYREGTFFSTYKLHFDLPGLSFGLEVAEQVGIVPSVVQRARDLKGKEASALDDAIAKVVKQSADYEQKITEAEQKIAKAEEERSRWAQEVDLLKKRRHDLAERVIEQYEEELRELRDKVAGTLKTLKKDESLASDAKAMTDTLGKLQKGLSILEEKHINKPQEPGKAAVFEHLKRGDEVYVTRFRKMGRVLRKGKTEQEKLEIGVGSLKFQVPLKELRIVRSDEKPTLKKNPPSATPKIAGDSLVKKEKTRLPVLSTETNSLDLRGVTVEVALEKTWQFLDSAIMRGEYAVLLIHGHGTHTLKQAIRKALASESPYAIEFAPGSPQDGGDGVTVVYLNQNGD